MKVLVDKMPDRVMNCLFGEYVSSQHCRVCKITNKICDDVKDCRCLKVNKLPDFLNRESHMCKKADVEWNDKCPKCGKRDTSVDYTGNSLASLYYVKCNNCGFTTDFHTTRDDAVATWNEVHKGVVEFGIKQDIILHPFTATTYSQAAIRTADKTLSEEKALMEGLVGINSEAGEALDIWKKYEFHKHDLDKKAIALELGDVLWYLNEAALALGYSLERIMVMNIEKLEERYPNGFDPERSKNREE